MTLLEISPNHLHPKANSQSFTGKDGEEKFYQDSTLEALEKDGSISSAMNQYLSKAVREKKNILVCYEWNFGSNYIIQALTREIDNEEPIAIISENPSLLTDNENTLRINPLSGGEPSQSKVELSQEAFDEIQHSGRRIIFDDLDFYFIENADSLVLNKLNQGNIASTYTSDTRSSLASVYYSIGKLKYNAQEIKPEKYTRFLEDYLPLTAELLREVQTAFDIVIQVEFFRNCYKITDISEIDQTPTVNSPYDIPLTKIFTYNDNTGQHIQNNESAIL